LYPSNPARRIPALKAPQLRNERATITPNLTLTEDGSNKMTMGYAG
jgi:hypothetical protein